MTILQELNKPGAPKMIVEALKLIGIKEVPGVKHNPVILNMARVLGLEKIYTADETPWCGLAMAYVAHMAGKAVPMTGYDILRAKEWTRFGTRPDEAMLGDILVFKRPGGFHVCLYVAESKDAYYVLGGNQSNSFGFTWMPKSNLPNRKLHAVRRPAYTNQPTGVRKIFMERNGELSKNEE